MQSFGHRLVGGGRQLFGDDLDRGRWKTLIDAFAMRTGQPVERIVSTTLRAYEGVLYGELAENGPARWVLPVGQARTHRRWYGLQYCSVCLGNDEQPHFRLSWRLAFHIWCERHRNRLRERCAQCVGPLALHRQDVGVPARGRRSPLLFCALCGHDRRDDPLTAIASSDEVALALQTQMLSALKDGVAVVGDRRIHSLPYFAGMAMLWSLLDDPKRSAGVWTDSLRLVPPLPAKPDGYRFGSFERLGLPERQLLLQACARLLDGGIPALIETLDRAGLSSDKLLRYSGRDRQQPPFWLWEPARFGLDKTMYVPSVEEIDAAIDHMRRSSNDGCLKIRDVCAFIGIRTNHSARVASRMHHKGVVRGRRREDASGEQCHLKGMHRATD